MESEMKADELRNLENKIKYQGVDALTEEEISHEQQLWTELVLFPSFEGKK